MAILSVKYPIIFTGSSSGFEYTIYQGSDTSGDVVYRGKSYGTEVDVSPVLQRFMNSDLVEVENVDLNTRDYNFSYELDSVVKTFTVSDGTTSQTFDVANDYNDKYILSYNSDYITSKSITGKYHPDSLIFIDVNSPDRTAVIASNVLPGSLSGFGSAHVTVKQNDVAGDGTIVEEINTNTGNDNKLCIVYNGSRYVIGAQSYGGQNDGIWYSDNITAWTNPASGIRANYPNIIYANSLFIAVLYVPAAGYIYTSPDGSTWTQRASLSGIPVYDVCRAGNYYAAIGIVAASGVTVIPQSTDGISWSSGNLGTVENSQYGKTMAVNSDGSIRVLLTDSANQIYRIFYSNNSAASPNLWTWTPRGSLNGIPVSFTPSRVRFVNNYFVAVGENSNNSQYYYSLDGISWVGRYTSGAKINSVAYGNGIYLMVLNDGTARYYNDADFLTGIITGVIKLSNSPINDVIWDGEKFVIVGDGNTIWTVEFQESELNTITVNGEEFPINYSTGCENFSLYWDNMLGGRSQLLLEGKKQYETYNNAFTRFDTNYDRTQPESFETRTIINEARKSFVLNTGYLTDQQSREMSDLFTSPKVWLHDHRNDVILSVYITDLSLTVRTFDNDKLIEYAINVSQAQRHNRR